MQTLHVRLDLFALVIMLGIAQGVFLGVFFLTGSRGRHVANRCFGWLMLSLSAILTEMGLEYTNYMFRTLALVDFAEPFNFLLGPLAFLFVYSRLHGRLPARWGWHLLPFGIWAANAVTWLYQPTEFKYNGYVNAWHPELPFVPSAHYLPEDLTGLRGYINELTMLSAFSYGVWSLWIIYQAYRRSGLSFGSANGAGPLGTLRALVVWNVLFPVLVLIVKLNYREDLGDHLLASCITLFIYATSFLIMRGSPFFAQTQAVEDVAEPAPTEPAPKKKYEKSALSDEVEEAVLQRLNRLLTDEKPYLASDLSLPKLAGRLGTSPHHLSQLMNDRLGQPFFDWLATYRIREAQDLLRDSTTAHLKIDEIAERVGYNSPSAFHTAFKRITSQTPAQFRAQTSSSRSARTS